ncbi:hypothetical protein D3C73_1360250 [compost metagenome]
MPFDTVHADRASQQLGKLFADGKSEPRPPILAVNGGMQLGEGLEQLPLLIRRDSDSRILNREMEDHLVGAADRAQSRPELDPA